MAVTKLFPFSTKAGAQKKSKHKDKGKEVTAIMFFCCENVYLWRTFLWMPFDEFIVFEGMQDHL